jgi:hypothetical protein
VTGPNLRYESLPEEFVGLLGNNSAGKKVTGEGNIVLDEVGLLVLHLLPQY